MESALSSFTMWHNIFGVFEACDRLSGWELAGVGEMVGVQGRNPTSPRQDVSLADFSGKHFCFCTLWSFSPSIYPFEILSPSDQALCKQLNCPLTPPPAALLSRIGEFLTSSPVLPSVTWSCSSAPRGCVCVKTCSPPLTPPAMHNLTTHSPPSPSSLGCSHPLGTVALPVQKWPHSTNPPTFQ